MGWHSWSGAATVILFLLNAGHGILRTTRLLGGSDASKAKNRLQWIWVSSFHRTMGAVSHINAMAAVILGLYSGWGAAVLGAPSATLLSAALIFGEIAILS